MKRSVKLSVLVLFFLLNGLMLKAQQKHFIYVQSEDRQPFAIVLQGKVYSSSDYGYIIIPNLTDGEYNFTVSFPMNKFPDQSFSYSVNKKDAGFYLKNANNEWALQNMQTQKLVMNNNAATAKNSAFGDMLSDVVSDSTLTKNPVAETPADNTGIVAGTVAATQLTDTAAGTGFITDSIVSLEKISESGTDTGTNMLFVDKSATGIDTISVFIPAETATTSAEQANKPATENNEVNNPTQESVTPTATQENNPATETAKADDKNITPPDNNNNLDAAAAGKTANDVSNPFYKPEENTRQEAAAVQSSPATTTTSSNNVNSTVKQDCDHMISDDDFSKLKRKMFSQNSDNEMVQYALKFMNKKCITTDQVKALGYLFSSDDGRYSLYDAMYNFVYDYGNYPALESQILDPYYKKRFAAMLR